MNEMEKQASVNEAFTNAFFDELEKIASSADLEKQAILGAALKGLRAAVKGPAWKQIAKQPGIAASTAHKAAPGRLAPVGRATKSVQAPSKSLRGGTPSGGAIKGTLGLG